MFFHMGTPPPPRIQRCLAPREAKVQGATFTLELADPVGTGFNDQGDRLSYLHWVLPVRASKRLWQGQKRHCRHFGSLARERRPFGSAVARAPKSKNAKVTLVYQHELPNVPGKSIKGVLVAGHGTFLFLG
jgi:hypothetical protein